MAEATGKQAAVSRCFSVKGYAMAALLVGLSVMGVALTAAVPVWRTAARREREAELVFRGEQYVQAITLFQRRYAGTFPPSVDVLLDQRFLRRRYRDPVTGGDFRVLYAGTGTASTTPLGRGGVVGVVSTSAQASLRLHHGRGRYNEWAFVATGGEGLTLPQPPPGRAPLSPPR
jgi:type II secretory pathway pseudopilin PulG